MTQEETIQQSLLSKFAYLEGSIRLPRPRRIYVELSQNNFLDVFLYARNHLAFDHLCMITGFDEFENLSFMYHLAQDKGVLLNIKMSVPKQNPVIKSIIAYFPGAEIYERELVDLFGAKVEGLPPGNRYPLTDDWPQGEYPLRKDWKNKEPPI